MQAARVRCLVMLVVVGTVLSACEAPQPVPAPQPTAQPTVIAPEVLLRQKAKDNLALGLRQYEAGTYEDAIKSFTAALDHGVLAKEDQASARKHLAFMHCVGNRDDLCRAEFRKALEIDPAFDLTQAESGHPVWGPIYRNVRSQVLAAREEAKPKPPLSKSEQLLADGMVKYDAAEYDPALKLFQAALKEGLPTLADQLKAVKHSAFSLCLSNRFGPCRAEFLKLFELDSSFDLSPAEAGHPSWTRTYAGAKKAAKDLQEAKAKEAAKPSRTGAQGAPAKPESKVETKSDPAPSKKN